MNSDLKKIEIPDYALEVLQKLEQEKFEAFVAGGCARDILLGKNPKDWDVATNASPEEILKIFPDSVYENRFGTVGVKIRKMEKEAGSEEKIKSDQEKKEKVFIVEVTTYRIESRYSDKRHPDSVKFAKTLEEDLSRRDFTVNAIALKIKNFGKAVAGGYEIFDFHGGREDLKNKVIRAVGEASERFDEDALRMMRAVRFAVTLGFSIDPATLEAVKKNAVNLKYISKERIRDEFEKIILSEDPAGGMKLLDETGLLEHIIPELLRGKGLVQAHHHYHGPYREVFDHAVAALEKCPSRKLEVRLAALLHDIGKPETARGKGKEVTFYNHEYVGAKIAGKILERLRFSRKVIEKTVLLVKNHMFYYNVDEVGEAGVRRVVRKVGLENINDLIDVRIADRLGSGVPKAVPYKLRHFKFMVEKVSRDAVSVKQLKINGHDLMEDLKIAPGPKIGAILDVLLSKVIESPELNDKKKLLLMAKELGKENLESLRKKAREKIEEEKKEEERLIKKKYWVE